MLLTATELTELAAQSVTDRNAYRGLSDHRPNVHQLSFGEDSSLIIGTWNVLHPNYTPAINGIPLPGKELPTYCKNMEDQAGLEHLPQFDPKNASQREDKIFSAIETFFKDHPQRTVLCLQEVWPGLLERLSATGLCSPLRTTDYECFSLTLVSPDLEYTGNIDLYVGHAFRLKDFPLAIANLHLPFNTDKSLAYVKQALEWGAQIILGDYNVQTKPIAEDVINEGGGLTITQYAEALVPGRNVTFAAHPEGWTIFGVRRNFAQNREQNQDHFDNIMFIDVVARSEPVQFDPQF